MPKFTITEYPTAKEELSDQTVEEEMGDFADATLELTYHLSSLSTDDAAKVLREWMELWRDSPRNYPVEVKYEDKDSIGVDCTTIFRYVPS